MFNIQTLEKIQSTLKNIMDGESDLSGEALRHTEVLLTPNRENIASNFTDLLKDYIYAVGDLYGMRLVNFNSQLMHDPEDKKEKLSMSLIWA